MRVVCMKVHVASSTRFRNLLKATRVTQHQAGDWPSLREAEASIGPVSRPSTNRCAGEMLVSTR